jgi:hypothetical protein
MSWYLHRGRLAAIPTVGQLQVSQRRRLAPSVLPPLVYAPTTTYTYHNHSLQAPHAAVLLPTQQAALVSMGDKPPSFEGSREWIGTCELFLLLDHFAGASCRISTARGGSEEIWVRA